MIPRCSILSLVCLILYGGIVPASYFLIFHVFPNFISSYTSVLNNKLEKPKWRISLFENPSFLKIYIFLVLYLLFHPAGGLVHCTCWKVQNVVNGHPRRSDVLHFAVSWNDVKQNLLYFQVRFVECICQGALWKVFL